MRSVIVAGLLLAAFTSAVAAPPPLVVRNNPGGIVEQFLSQEQQLEAQGRGVVVRGRCASACTVVLHNPNVCVAAGGSFMFHSAFIAADPEHGDFRRVQDDAQATAAMWGMYPPGVQAWIMARGGLTARPLNMSAQAAWSAGVRRCQ